MLKMIFRSLTNIYTILQRIETSIASVNPRVQQLEAENDSLHNEIMRLKRENRQHVADIESLAKTVYTAHESLAKLLQYQVALNEAVGMAYTDATIPNFVLSEHVLKIHCDTSFKKN